MTSHPSVRAFLDAAECTAALLGHDDVAAAWERPSALDGFTVGGLAGHVYGGIRRVEVGLDEPLPDPPRWVTVAEFYGVNRVDDPDELATGLHPFIRDDGERRAAWGPATLHERFVEVVERLGQLLATEPLDRPIPVLQVPDGVVTLEDYLATRTVELVVHSDDLAVSVGMPSVDLPATACDVTVGVLVDLARHRSGDLAVVRALARRERSDPGVLHAL